MKPNVFVSPLDDSIVIKYNGKTLVVTREEAQRLRVNLRTVRENSFVIISISNEKKKILCLNCLDHVRKN